MRHGRLCVVKNRQKRSIKEAQALHIAPTEHRGGVKVCPDLLKPIIELANLPGDQQLPDISYTDFRGDRNTSSVPHIPLAEYLPDAVRLSLLEVMTNPQQWEMTPEEWAAGWKIHLSLEHARYYLQASAMTDRYNLIRSARTALSAIVESEPKIPVTTFLKRGSDGRGAYGGDTISDALLEAEWDYIKRCEVCKKFFYAQRNTQDTCPPVVTGTVSPCGRALRTRRKRANDKLRVELANKKAKKRGR